MVTLLGSVLENARCDIDVPVGGVTIDPITGNPYPNTRKYEIYLYLKDNLRPPKQLQESQPRDTPMTWVEGWVTRVIDPLSPLVILPPSMPIIAAERIHCDIDGKTGNLYLIDRYANAAIKRYVNLTILGEEIWGWFDREEL